MPIVSLNMEKIYVERKTPLKGNIKISNDLIIKDVAKENLQMGPKQEDVLRFTFHFSSKYEPGVGEISMIGHILYLEKKETLNKVLEAWKKTRKIDSDLMTNLVNTALTKCNIKALALSQEVNLPPHLHLPIMQKKVDKAAEYIG